MRAELGKRYCQIIAGRVHWKFDITRLPEWRDDAFQVVEITGPEPNEGDLYDGAVFTPPPAPPPDPQRQRRGELLAALQLAEDDATLPARVRLVMQRLKLFIGA